MTDRPEKPLSPDWLYAGNVLQAVERFVDAADGEGALPVLREALGEQQRLQGGHLETSPERFTVEHLIEPCLSALGYAPVGQPVDLVEHERHSPDFRLRGVDGEYVVVVESKAFNADAAADREDLAAYLDAFGKYREDLDGRYLVGIATDGIRWLLYGKHLETGTRDVVGRRTISTTLREVMLDRLIDDYRDDGRWREQRRQELTAEFVPLFAAPYLPGHVGDALPGPG